MTLEPSGASRALFSFLAVLGAVTGPGWRLDLLADDAAALREGKRDIKQAIQSGDVEKLDTALAQLSREGDAGAMKLLLDWLERAPASEDSVYWSLIGGIVSFRSRAAMEELGKFVVQRKAKAIARDLAYGLGKNTSPHVVKPFRPLLTDAPDELRILVAKKIARVRTPDAVDALIELLKAEEKLKLEKLSSPAWIAVDGLTKITRQSFGPSSINWEGWWRKNREKPLPAGEDDGSGPQTGTAVDFLKLDPERVRREQYIGVEEAPLKSVVVLSGKFTRKVPKDLNNDHMEETLERMKVPHTVVLREDFAKYDLKDAGVLLINCVKFHEFCICPTCKVSGELNSRRLYACSGCDKHINWSPQLSGSEISKIKSFVLAGGYLFVEDWIAEEVVEKAFGEYVAADDKRVLSPAMVDVVPARGMGTHPYLKGIFEPKFVDGPVAVAAGEGGNDAPGAGKGAPANEPGAGPEDEPGAGTTVVVQSPKIATGSGDEPGDPVKVKHQWKIDDKSYPLKVMDKGRVVTILTSGQLQKVTGGDGCVAVAFRPGSASAPPGTRAAGKGVPGVVAVVLSHFNKQESTDDNISIQNLLLNFLIDANAAREARGAGKRPEKKAGEAGKK